jgi:CRISPR/Cas system endoribonuclease Cas6 (RAMP superfamily)
MRVRFQLTPRNSEAILTRAYQHQVGAAIYQALDDKRLHDSRRTKLFCISPLFWQDRVVDKETIRFRGPGYLLFCSPNLAQINRLLNVNEVILGGDGFAFRLHSFIDDPLFETVMAWRVPPGAGVVTRRNLPTDKSCLVPLCRPKETALQLEHSLRHRWNALCEADPQTATRWCDEDDPAAWIKGQPIRVEFIEPEKSRIIRGEVNGSNLKAWMGWFRVAAPEAIQRLIWSTGIGAKTALGFGYCEPLNSKGGELCS